MNEPNREVEIDGIPVEEIAPGVYEGTIENEDGSIEDVVIWDPMEIESYNGVPLN
jgi:hypothetical protein